MSEKLVLTIDEESKEYTIPTGWDEVTVNQFSKIYGLKQDEMTMVEYFAEVLSCLLSIDIDDVYMMDSESFTMLSNKIDFIQNDLAPVEVDYIKIGDETFYLKKDYNSLNMGEIISLEKLMEKHNNDLGVAIADLLCVFLRKKKPNGKLEGFKNSFMERSEMFGEVNITEIYNVLIFFSNGNNSLGSNTKDYLVSPKNK